MRSAAARVPEAQVPPWQTKSPSWWTGALSSRATSARKPRGRARCRTRAGRRRRKREHRARRAAIGSSASPSRRGARCGSLSGSHPSGPQLRLRIAVAGLRPGSRCGLAVFQPRLERAPLSTPTGDFNHNRIATAGERNDHVIVVLQYRDRPRDQYAIVLFHSQVVTRDPTCVKLERVGPAYCSLPTW